MGKMSNIALEYKEQNENEWEQQQRALLLSEGYTNDEVEEIIQEMKNEYYYEMAEKHGDWENLYEN
ncbi:MAG TPA: hypothetical protein VLB82_08820 [Thermodesulfobacteriota bacterium]|nr:hypothetical protein [Thermodesulfobacteriota bacterium]